MYKQVPQEIMVSCYERGHHYNRHLDSYGDQDNPRAFTAILYVNPDYEHRCAKSDGGYLRGWSGREQDAHILFEIMPQAGDLVLFKVPLSLIVYSCLGRVAVAACCDDAAGTGHLARGCRKRSTEGSTASNGYSAMALVRMI